MDYRIPFHKMNLKLDEYDLFEIGEIINKGQVVNGKWAERLENHFKNEFNVKHAIACSSCTQGLFFAVDAVLPNYGVVGMPAFTWPSTYFAARQHNNGINFLDINKDTWIVDLELLEKYLNNFDLVIAVDIFGSNADIKLDCPVIYDAAHGYGLQNLGHRGLVEVVSLAMTKTVTAMQGGMVLTNDDKLASTMRENIKMFAKITEVNAYVALQSIKDFKKDLDRKIDVILQYEEGIDSYFVPQFVKETNYSVYAIMLQDQEKRDRIVEKFNEKGIEAKVYYKPLIKFLPETDYVYSRILALPIWKGVERYIPEICEIINNA